MLFEYLKAFAGILLGDNFTTTVTLVENGGSAAPPPQSNVEVIEETLQF